MSVILQPLWEPVQLTNAAVNYYTAGAFTLVGKCTVSNPTAGAAAVTIYWVPSGQSAAADNAIVTARIVQPKESFDVWPLIGHVLNVGDMIAALASVGGVLNFFGSGTTDSG